MATKLSHTQIQGAAVNVLDYMAAAQKADVLAGTGSVDVSSPVQSAIDALDTAGGGLLSFPAGTYLIGANITLKSNVSIYAHPGTAIFKLSGNDRNCLKADTLDNVEISGIFFDGQKPTVGWETTNNYDFGIRLGNNATSQSITNIKIKNCTFKDIGLDGIYAANYSNVRVIECDFINCRRWGIVPQAETYNAEHFSIEDCYFDCDYGGGPVGKEYPLGAIDSEPNSGELTNITYKNIRGYRNNVYMVGSGTYTYDAYIENVSVSAGNLYITNNIDVNIRNSTVRGTTGYLLVDTLNDSFPTKINSIDLRFLNTGRDQPVRSDGRRNLMPYDHGYEEYWSGSLSASGTGTSSGQVLRNIDGEDVFLTDHQIGPTTGSYSTIRETLTNTISEDDQVVLILEVERTDNNSASGNYLTVNVGANFSRLVRVDQNTTSTLMFAWRAPATEASPFVSIGLSGNPGVQVNMLFRKVILLVNPKQLTDSTFLTKTRPFRRTITGYTGPSFDAANARQISLSGSASNVDTITSGYNGQVLSLYGATNATAFTVRDASVSSGNIELMNNNTYALTNGTSNNAITLVYDSGTSKWIQAS